jgi:hypothetical protein
MKKCAFVNKAGSRSSLALFNEMIDANAAVHKPKIQTKLTQMKYFSLG